MITYNLTIIAVICLIFVFSANKSLSAISKKQGLNDNLQNAHLSVNLENGTKLEVQEYRAFWCKKQCYVWDPTKYEFSKLADLSTHTYCSDLNAEKNYGLSQQEQILR